VLEFELPHLNQTRQAIFAIENVDDAPHDPHPSLSHGVRVGRICFSVSLSGWESGFFGALNCFIALRPRNRFTGSCAVIRIGTNAREATRFGEPDISRNHPRVSTGVDAGSTSSWERPLPQLVGWWGYLRRTS